MTTPCYVYEIRANRDLYADIDAFRAAWKGIVKKWVVQLERGESGYEHWQGRVSLIKKARKPELLKLLKSADKPLPNYCEATTSGEKDKEAFYATKEATRIDGPWTDRDVVRYIPRQFKDLTPFPWQQTVLDSYKDFQDRTVDCIVDVNGCGWRCYPIRRSCYRCTTTGSN